ncbi:hypothetical protein BC834DRAFT_871150 [Gloeopeniophorella convolvens]|nr:hypothetical protein BC834DRAFT_871150 [Gloeopeniophorella convolvens]
MVLISDKKYACEACIKGHRSSACKHTDAPSSRSRKRAVPSHNASTAVNCEKRNKFTSNVCHVCHCKDGGDCHCSTAKKTSRKAKDVGASLAVSPASATGAAVGPSLHALRPVLPRPPQQMTPIEPMTSHTHPHNHRFSHGSAFFSPYGRAYEEHYHSSEDSHPDSNSENGLVARRSTDLAPWSSDSSGSGPLQGAFHPLPEILDDFDSPEAPAGLPGFCTCGDPCACTSCPQHRGPIAWTSREACSNPVSCGCLNVSEVLPHPAPTPPTTPQNGLLPQQFEPLDEWIKSIPMLPPSFEESCRANGADFPMFDLPRIVEPMPIALDSLPDVFHETSSQCICPNEERLQIGDYCLRCQRRCDDLEPDGDQDDMLPYQLSGQRARFSPDVSMLAVPGRSRASSTSSAASDLSSLYPRSIEDTSCGPASSLLPPSLSRARHSSSDITSPFAGEGVGPSYALPFNTSVPDLPRTSDLYDSSHTGSIPMLF